MAYECEELKVEVSQEFVDPTPDLVSPVLRTVFVGEHFQIESDLTLGSYVGALASYSYPSLLTGAVIETSEVEVSIVDANGTFALVPTTEFTASAATISLVAVGAAASGIMRRDISRVSSSSGVSDSNAVLGTANLTDTSINFITSGVVNEDKLVIAAPSVNAGTYYARVISATSLELFTDAALTTRATLTDATDEEYVITNDHPLTGTLLVSYRAQRNDLVGVVKLIDRQQDIETIAGIADPLNPLGLAAAIHNGAAPGIAFFVTALSADDATAHAAALAELEEEAVYTIVPLHQNDEDLDVASLYKAHVEDASIPENSLFRIALLSSDVPDKFVRVASRNQTTAGNGGTVVIQDGSGPNELLLTDVGGDFLANGVEPGDLVQVTASVPSDALDQEPWLVKLVPTATTLVLVGDYAGDLGSADTSDLTYSVETADLTTSEQASYMGDYTEGILSRRVTNLVAGRGEVKTIFTGDTWVPSYFANASLAGLVSYLPPQQGLSTFDLPGISDIRYTSAGRFTRSDLNEMGARGNLILVKPSEGDPVTIRRQRTTNTTTTAEGELSITKDIDFGSYYLIGALDPLLGRYNIVKSFFSKMQTILDSVRHNLTSGELPGIGPVWVSMVITELGPYPGSKDKVLLVLEVQPPYPVNRIKVRLLIS